MKFKFLAEYLLVRMLEAFFLRLPDPAAIWIGERIGLMFSEVLSKRKRLVLENLRISFPEKDFREINRIALNVWKNLGRTAIEFVRIPKLTQQNVDKFIVYSGDEHVARSLEGKRGVVLVSFHFSNWEISGFATQFRFGKLLAIARPMKNSLVEKWVQRKRTESGNRISLHRNAVKTSLKWLKGNNILGVMVDQNLYTGGVFADFLGRPAATTTLPGLLHVRTGCPILLVYLLREGRKFHVIYDPPFEFPPLKDDREKILACTQIINDRIGELVKKVPENWFWVHNRWKRKPEESNVQESVKNIYSNEK